MVALPWLAVKYAPVAAALAAVAAWRAVAARRPARPRCGSAAAVLVVAGLAYLVAHRLLYGGWTVYAAGDHFVGGELTVVGTDPDYLGRSRRLVGLLVDRGFGLAAWAPVFLLAVPALAALARRRPPAGPRWSLPLAAGWVNATWVALTMHGWWWPGRQVVVVAAVRRARCRLVGRVGRPGAAAVRSPGLAGMALWGWLVAEVLAGHRTLVVDFESTAIPSTGPGARCCPTTARHRRRPGCSRRSGWSRSLRPPAGAGGGPRQSAGEPDVQSQLPIPKPTGGCNMSLSEMRAERAAQGDCRER